MNPAGKSPRSQQYYERAKKIIPGGLSRNTILRKPHPDYADFGKGCYVTDIDGNRRIDLANNMASLIHGHADPAVVEAVRHQLNRGTAFTMATEAELELAGLLCQRVAHFEKIRFANSGTEAVMAAIKASRAATGRPKIAKVEGAYHGTYDDAEVSQNATPEYWGPVDRPASVPVAIGTPRSTLDNVIVLPFNDVRRSISLLNRQAGDIACVLLDPLPHRLGLISATADYVGALREWTSQHDALLVFDEVITFRMGLQGAAGWYDVRPDLVTLGKIIGGGFPVGALAGTDQAMSVLDPQRQPVPFPFSGTFSANPITMTAGRVAMERYDEQAIRRINELGESARAMIAQAIRRADVPACVTGAGSMFRVHLRPQPPTDYRSAWQAPQQAKLTTALVDYLYHHGFMTFRTCTAALSTAVTESEVQLFAGTLEKGLRQIRSSL